MIRWALNNHLSYKVWLVDKIVILFQRYFSREVLNKEDQELRGADANHQTIACSKLGVKKLNYNIKLDGVPFRIFKQVPQNPLQLIVKHETKYSQRHSNFQNHLKIHNYFQMNIQNPKMHQRERLLHQTAGSSMLRVALEKITLCKARRGPK